MSGRVVSEEDLDGRVPLSERRVVKQEEPAAVGRL
jgi:hypothetical protein